MAHAEVPTQISPYQKSRNLSTSMLRAGETGETKQLKPLRED